MKKLFALLFISATVLTSCEGENEEPLVDNCINFIETGINSVSEIPGDFASGTAYRVTFNCSSGCGNFDSFEEIVEGNTRTIKVIAKYEGCTCTDDTPLREATYGFNPTVPGIYTLKFLKTDGTFFTETFVVL